MQNLKSCNITVMVADMDNAVRFYTETLGLKLEHRYENHYAEIEAPGLRIGLHPVSDKLVTEAAGADLMAKPARSYKECIGGCGVATAMVRWVAVS